MTFLASLHEMSTCNIIHFYILDRHSWNILKDEYKTIILSYEIRQKSHNTQRVNVFASSEASCSWRTHLEAF